MSEAEWAHLNTLIEQQKASDSIAVISQSLLTVLSRTTDSREIVQLIKILTRIGSALMAKADLERLLPILKVGRKLIRRMDDKECLEDLQSMLARASEAEVIQSMLEWMRASEADTAPKLYSSYLSALDSEAVPAIIELIEGLNEQRELPAVQLALMKLCAGNVQLLRPGLESFSTKVIISTLKVLAKIGDSEASPFIVPLLSHDDSTVRYESAVATVKVRAPGFEKHLQPLVGDAESRMRMLALQVLAKVPNLESKDFLVSRLESSEFMKLDSAEQTLFFKVVARHESKELHAALLKQLKGEKKWFQERSNQMLMGAGAAALVVLPIMVKMLGWLFGLGVWGAMAGFGAMFVRGEFERLQATASDLIEPSARCLGQMKSKAAGQILSHIAQQGHGRAQKACKRMLMKR